MKAVRGHLVIDDGDTSAAIVSLLGTMPAADQAVLLAGLVPTPAPGLDELIAAQPVEVLEVLAVRHFSRSALRRRRLDARDEDFRELAREIIAGIGLTGSGIDHQRGVSTRYGQPWPLCREPLAERPSSTWARRRIPGRRRNRL